MENRKMEIAEFYKKVFSDFKLKEKLEEKVKKITNEEDFKKLIREEIVPLMKKFKVNFSEEDLLNYEKETLKEISDEILENVSGGASIKSALLAGGVLSMVLLGGTGLSASAMDDEPPALPEQKQIIQTSSNEQRQNNSNNVKIDNDNSQDNGSNVSKGGVIEGSKSEISHSRIKKEVPAVIKESKGSFKKQCFKDDDDYDFGDDHDYDDSAKKRFRKKHQNYDDDSKRTKTRSRKTQYFKDDDDYDFGDDHDYDDSAKKRFRKKHQNYDDDSKRTKTRSRKTQYFKDDDDYDFGDGHDYDDENGGPKIKTICNKEDFIKELLKYNDDLKSLYKRTEPFSDKTLKELFEKNKGTTFTDEKKGEESAEEAKSSKKAKKGPRKSFNQMSDNEKQEFQKAQKEKKDRKKAKKEKQRDLSESEKKARREAKKKVFSDKMEDNQEAKEEFLNSLDEYNMGKFNYEIITENINIVLGKMENDESLDGVIWEETKYYEEDKSIKLVLSDNPTKIMNITLDDIRMFNLEKIRRAYDRNQKRHLIGKWEPFEGQKFAGILSGKHSLLDPGLELGRNKTVVKAGGLEQKLIVATPFCETELHVYYYILSDEGDNFLEENERLVKKADSKGIKYEKIIKYFYEFNDDDKRKILQAILGYLSTEVIEKDITALNKGEKPLEVFNRKVMPCELVIEDDNKRIAMADFAAILMFCENSQLRVSTGGKWERAFLNAANKYLDAESHNAALDAVIPGFWLHVETGTETPQAIDFSRLAVINSKDQNPDKIQSRVVEKVKKISWEKVKSAKLVDVHEKVKEVNSYDFSNSSHEEDSGSTTEEAHKYSVNLKIKIGENTYKLLKTVKCTNVNDAKNRIETKYKYLKPTKLNIDEEAIPAQPADAVSTTASDAEETDKK